MQQWETEMASMKKKKGKEWNWVKEEGKTKSIWRDNGRDLFFQNAEKQWFSNLGSPISRINENKTTLMHHIIN